MSSPTDILLYQSPNGQTQLEVHLQNKTVWLTQAQMVELFDTTKQNISLHTRNAFKEGELDEDAVVKESLTTVADGKSYRARPVRPSAPARAGHGYRGAV